MIVIKIMKLKIK